MKKKPLSVDCPTCGKSIKWEEASRWKPFCSERCKLIDLGDWAEGNNRIPDDPLNDSEISDNMDNDHELL